MPGYQSDWSKPSGRHGCVMEPMSRCSGGMSGLSVWTDQEMPRLPSGIGPNPGEEDL